MVLNLVINGIPSIQLKNTLIMIQMLNVLNLIINGIPSIHYISQWAYDQCSGFKPYYKWNTFNTNVNKVTSNCSLEVLNLIINGIPSIPMHGFMVR